MTRGLSGKVLLVATAGVECRALISQLGRSLSAKLFGWAGNRVTPDWLLPATPWIGTEAEKE